ncbi:putative serine/threonine protein phosphatase [Synechococcus phage S-CBWM1]|uniref:Putative serine/threonine protein phosphatase n=1 Tax=Synechococcus phage S-CBWM1 TaxID=2053653 RepID=A0A3G1L3F8_9CAUD|nr:putative serine/threonine protein phosphatase [Synechococcus phage S-CBWM1]ATW62724.1 putative serine/threonine protein phosphatase [Synechococcus phage S-CBWM1]
MGDVHSQDEPLQKAVDFLRQNSLTPIFLGDLFDSQHEFGNAAETYKIVRQAERELGAIVLHSNHQHKLLRFLAGNPVRMTENLGRTLRDFRESEISLTEVGEWLSSHPYGAVFQDCRGREYRAAHAFFPGRFQVPSALGLSLIHRVEKKLINQFLYGPVVKDDTGKRVRLEWWKEPKNRDFRRVSGHYHTIYEDRHSLVLDGGSGGSSQEFMDPGDEFLPVYDVNRELLLRFRRP